MTGRVAADGKHLAFDGAPFRVKGVTYGSFVPRRDGEPFPEAEQLRADLHAIARAGLNTVRTYTLPPQELFDTAGDLGLRILVGLHYPDWREELVPGRAARRRILDAGRRAIDVALARCAGNPSVLALSVGNEVPADVVRVHGSRSVEDTLGRLVEEVHAADADLLVTYSNFPSTEYLEVPGLDLVCFNVFLEDPEALRRYLRHLQVVSLDSPLLVTELGLAAQVHGEAVQAESLAGQLRAVDEAGCAGATVFSWTDEWGVAGQPVDGWGFGVTDAERRPKAALDVVSSWARTDLRDLRREWPPLSVVVCAYNEERTIGECLASLAACDYPGLEVVVCDDGSTDATRQRAGAFGFRVLGLAHRGLSAARNAGLEAATGDLVAYLDADAYCHPEWPYHLALSLDAPAVVATGGPNLPVPGAGLVERAVAASPGGPIHVLVSDDRAEHVPGCNMAFRRPALQSIGGFDPVYTSAGDDVDVCWKIADRGFEIGFAAAAQVRHHRRTTVGGYLRQQRGYGRAERMLSGPHIHRFNRWGQARWRGAIYTRQLSLASLVRPVIYYGWQGSAAFQPVAHRRHQRLWDLATPFVPLASLLTALALVCGIVFPPALAVAAASGAFLIFFSVAAGVGVGLDHEERHPRKLRALVALFNLVQPTVRLAGRLQGRPSPQPPAAPPCWTGERLVWLGSLERQCAAVGCSVRRGAPHHAWDLEVCLGPFAKCRISAAVVWQWTRLQRTRLRVRGVGLAGAAGAALAVTAVAGPRPALAVLAGLALAGVGEAAYLRRVVRRAIVQSVPPEAPAVDGTVGVAG